MIIHHVRAPMRTGGAPGDGGRAPHDQDLIRHLRRVRAGTYDRRAAELLAFTSAWAYSSLETFAERMARRGLVNCECVSISITNEALLLDTSAIVVQSEDRKLAILCFRGTEPRNIINWLMDASARMEPFYSAGYVHGGFFNTIRALQSGLESVLGAAYRGESICAQAQRMNSATNGACGAVAAPGDVEALGAGQAPETSGDSHELDALYISGHSLGGALALLAAAVLHADPRYDPQKSNLRGIYTYGQPMIGDAVFALEHRDNIGKSLFRHVYNRDIVPRLPPLTMGRFEHFGQQYNSTDTGWMIRPRPVNRAYTVGLSTLIGVTAWLTQTVFPIGWLRLPFSWGDHAPQNYMRTSIAVAAGAELE